MKKLLAGLLSLTLTATVVATPLGECVSNKIVDTTISAKAYDGEDDYEDGYFTYGDYDCYYEYDVVTIERYNGNETNLTIPSTINGKIVKYIDYEAFRECNSLKEVTIPGSVKYIYSNAFRECANLEKVTLESGVRSISQYAFVGLKKLKHIEVPKSVTNIGERAFGFDIEYGEEEGDYDFIYVDGFSMDVYDGTEGYAYATDYEGLKYNVLENDDCGTVEVTDINNFKSPHNAPAGMKKTWVYKVEGAEALKITFSNQTKLTSNDDDYINLYSNDDYSYSRDFYGNSLAGQSIVIPGDTISVYLRTYGDQSYGFDVVKVEKASSDDIVMTRTLENNYLEVTQEQYGRFHLNKLGDGNYYDYEGNRLLYNTTSFASFSVDGEQGKIGDDIPYTQLKKDDDAKIIIAKANTNGIEIEENMKLEKNLATGQDDVLKLTYTYSNTDTKSHKVGCHIFFDTMIGYNDEAPFRVPGVGDITTGTVFESDKIPMYWQAFDSLEDPNVIAQGRFYKNKDEAPDKVIFGNYGKLNSAWSESVNIGEENGDSAVAMFWNERPLAPGESITFTTYYGLSDLTQDLSGNLTLSVTGDKFAGQIDFNEDTLMPVYGDVIFTAYAQNVTGSNINNVTAKIELPEGFSLVNENENTEVKTVASVSAGDIQQFDWKVKVDPNKVEELTKYDVKISLTGDGVEGKTLTRNITIPATLTEKVSINKATVVSDKTYTYTGKEIIPEITLKNGESELVEGKNYTVEYVDNINAGTAKAIFKGMGMYNGQIEVEYAINPVTISSLRAEIENTEFIYTGSTISPVVKSIKDTNENVWDLSNFNISYSDNVNVGDAYITIKPSNSNFEGSKTIYYTINSKDVNDLTTTLDNNSFIFDGTAKEPLVNIKFNDTLLVKDVDYTVTYNNNINAGTASVIVTGKGNYAGAKEIDYIIKSKDINNLTTTLDNNSFIFDGTAKEPAVAVKFNNTLLIKDVDYTVAYNNNINAGTASVIVTGKGNYTGTVTKTFKINAKNISTFKGKISKTTFTYNGKVQKPEIVIYDGKTALKINQHYKTTFSKSKNPGVYTVKITGINNYTGTKTTSYTILPSQATGLKASKNSTNSVKLSWNKVTGAKGYNIYQMKNNKWSKIKTVTGTSFTVSKLKAGTNYKFCVKPYTKSGSKTIYGSRSKTLTTSTTPAKVNFKLTAGKKKATVKWSKVTGATGYKVYYKTSKNGKWKLLKTANNKTTSYTKTKLSSKKTYWFTVKAYRNANKKTYNGSFATKSIKIK